MGKDLITDRKLDHIMIVLKGDVESKHSTLLEEVYIPHRPLPEMDLDDVNLTTRFCGKELRAPLMITAMTGGHPRVTEINAELARAAEEYGIAVGVGSQRAAIENPALEYTFRVVRDNAPSTLVVANLGAPQLSKGYGVREAVRAVEMIEADVLAIHLNPGQEAYQAEGDPHYRGVIDKIVEIADALKAYGVELLVKETGNGLSAEDVSILYKLGIKCFDVAGLGGTNWIKVEVKRSLRRGLRPKPAGPLADYWGVPTALSIIETRSAAPGAYIVASGGIRTGLDAARAIALGADVAGVALPALRSLVKATKEGLKIHPDKLKEYLGDIIYQLKTILFLSSSKTPTDLWRTRIAIGSWLALLAESKDIDIQDYIDRVRLEPLRVRN